MSSVLDEKSGPLARIDASGVLFLQRPHMTIHDEVGGMLRLDLTLPGMDELAHACKALLESKLAPGTCLIRVVAGDDTYRLRQVTRARLSFGITRVSAQAREMMMCEDAIRQVIGILDSTAHLRGPSITPRSSLISYTL